MEQEKKYHYVYRIECIDTGEFYIGSRSCNCHPSLDNYLGSMQTWKPNKDRLKKEVIDMSFNDRTSCMEMERILIIKHYNDILNRNFHIPGTFEMGKASIGNAPYRDITSGKCMRIKHDDPILLTGQYIPIWLGKTHSIEAKQKMSISARSRKITDENERRRREGISINNRKPKSDQHRINISLSKRGDKNPMYGKPSLKKGHVYEKIKCIYCDRDISVTKVAYHTEICKQKKSK